MESVDDVGHVRLTGIRAIGRHGVHPGERELGQPFSVDVDLEVLMDTRADELAGTVDYGKVAQAVAAEIAGEPVNLVETLAGRIADCCLACDERVRSVTVSVHKPHAPVGVVLDDVAVVLRRGRTS